jgi:hypothetical protein
MCIFYPILEERVRCYKPVKGRRFIGAFNDGSETGEKER